MPDKVVFLKLVEINSESPKEFQLQIPVGEQVYSPASSKVVGPRRTPWKIPFDVDNPDPETTDELIGIKSGEKPFSYTESDLDGNFIELSANPSEQIGTSSANVSFECQGYSGILSMRLCSYPDSQSPTRTLYNSRVTTIYSKAYVNSYTWEQYRNSSSWNPDDPWGDRWVDPNGDWFNSNAFRAEELNVLNGVRPRISFHIETFRNPSWETGRYINCLVMNHWFWDMSDAQNPVYSIRNQQIIALKYISDEPITPQKPKTPSKTPNSTPEGGRGNRNNYSYPVPMPSSSGLTGLGYFATGGTTGIHLYELDQANWVKLTQWLLGSSALKLLSQAINYISMGSTALDTFVLSVVKLMLPVDFPTGTTVANEVVYVGYTSAGSGNNQAVGTSLKTRYAHTETWTFNVEKYSDTFLDFEPHTTIEAHIPFCGVCRIPTDACMGGSIEVRYIVDVITGSCCAIIRAQDQFGNYQIISVLSGQCGINIPLTAANHFTNNITGSVASIVAGMTSGNPIPVMTGTAGLMTQEVGTKSSGTSTSGGAAAILGDRALYVAIYHPQDLTGLKLQDLKQVDGFGNKLGYTAASFAPLSSFADNEYVEALINPNSIQTATDEEKEAIRSIIQRGVYI